MEITFVLGISILFQVAAAVMALRLIRVTSWRRAWLLLATAFTLMAIRRSLTLAHIIIESENESLDMAAELVGLGTSVLIALGIAYIQPLLRAIKHSNDMLLEMRKDLEQRVEARTTELIMANRALQAEINERTEASKQLRFQAALLDNVRESVIATDLEGNVTYWGKGAEALYGYPADEVIGEAITFVVTPEEAPQELDRIQQVLEHGTWHGDYMQRRKDESTFWADTHLSVVAGKDGTPYALVGIDRDITHEKQVEAALRESEARFRTTFEKAAIGIALASPDGYVITANPALSQMLGYAPRELIRKSFGEVSHPNDVAREAVLHGDVLAGEIDSYQIEKRYFHKNGRLIWGRLTSSLVRDEDGEPQFFISMIEDITAHKQAEEALRESELRYRAVVEDQTELICRFLPDGTLTFANAAYLRYFGRTEAEMIGTSFFPHVPEEDYPDIRRVLGNFTVDNPVLTDERRAITPDGIKWQQWTTRAIFDEDGLPMVFQVVGRDITQRKQAEQALQEAYDLMEQRVVERTAELQAANEQLQQEIAERKQAEDALRASESRYRALVENFPNGAVLLFDTHLRYMLANGSALTQAGVLPEFFEGHLIEDVLAPDVFAQVVPHYRAALDGETHIFEVNDGTRLYEIYTLPIHDAQGNITAGMVMTQDITGRKQAEEALQQSEARYRGLFQDSPISLWEEDFSAVKTHIDELRTAGVTDFRAHFEDNPDDVLRCLKMSKLLDVNQATLDLFQIESADRLFEGLHTLMDNDSISVFTEELIAFAQGRTSFEGEEIRRALNGEPLHTIVNASIAPGFEQTWAKVLVSITDITERKRAEHELRIQRAFLRQIIDASPNLIFVKDREGRFTLANQATAHRYNTTVEDLIRKTEAEVNPFAEEVATYQREDRTVFDTQDALFIPEERTTDIRTGETVWYQTNKVPLVAPDGSVTHVLGVATNINERKQAEEALQAQQALLHQIVDANPNLIFVKDHEGRFTLVNRTMATLYDSTVEDLLGKTDADFVPLSEEVVEFEQADQQVFEMGEPVFVAEESVTYPSPIGRRWYQTSKVPLRGPDGTVRSVLGVATDITERKRAEEALRETHQTLEALIVSSSAAIIALDLDGRVTIWNPAAERLFGWRAVEVLGKPYPIVVPEGQDELFSLVDQSHQARTFTELEIVRQRKDGTFVDVSMSTAPLRSATGAVVGAMGILTDITERKQAEEALRASEAINRAIIGAIPDLMFRLGPNGTYVDVYADKNDLLVLPEETLIGKTLREALPPPVAEIAVRNFELAFETGKTQVFEYELDVLSGRRHFEARFAVSSPSEVLAIVRDITERKQAEEAYRLLVEHSLQGLTILQNDHIVFANPRVTEISGYTPNEITAMSLDDIYKLLWPDDAPVVWKNIGRLMAGKPSPERYEMRLVHKDGSLRWLESYATLIEYRGQPAVQIAHSDITERKQVEEQALELVLERERVKILAEFIQDASHEFATPLSVINTGLYLLGQFTEPEKQQHRLTVMSQQVTYIQDLVAGMLTMTRLDSGVPFAAQQVSISHLLEVVLTRFEYLVSERGLNLTVEIGDDLPFVKADMAYLHTAVANIVENAVMFTHEGDSVTIETGQRDGYVVVAVRDTGIGIPEADLPHIFDRFYRVDKARSARGAGLGLSIARKIIERHGGHIDVQSTLDEGSTFTIFLPIGGN